MTLRKYISVLAAADRHDYLFANTYTVVTDQAGAGPWAGVAVFTDRQQALGFIDQAANTQRLRATTYSRGTLKWWMMHLPIHDQVPITRLISP